MITPQVVPSSPVTTVAPHQRRKAERPQELLEAALSLFVEKGYAATRAEEVAHRAGVSKGTLYLYYPSKEELLKAVIRQFIGTEITAGGLEVEQFHGSCTEAMRTLLPPSWLRLLNSAASGVFKLIMTEVHHIPELADFYQQEIVGPGEKIVADLLQRGIDQGEFRPVDVSMTVRSITLPLAMLCIHKHSLGCCGTQHQLPFDPDRFVQAHIDLVLAGLSFHLLAGCSTATALPLPSSLENS
ncbi:MAG: TetR family transcriptional regulator [Leptothrix ochracea]|uniref:TetR family transcriptional regulator n=1 Tax=Leptothrix ochracea TaxID=735331 RepID=UPI0034E1BE4E